MTRSNIATVLFISGFAFAGLAFLVLMAGFFGPLVQVAVPAVVCYAYGLIGSLVLVSVAGVLGGIGCAVEQQQ